MFLEEFPICTKILLPRVKPDRGIGREDEAGWALLSFLKPHLHTWTDAEIFWGGWSSWVETDTGLRGGGKPFLGLGCNVGLDLLSS